MTHQEDQISIFNKLVSDCINKHGPLRRVKLTTPVAPWMNGPRVIISHMFTTAGYSFSLIWSKYSIYLFDSHSRDINGFFIDQNNRVVLSFKTSIEVDEYIKTEYSKQLSNFHETEYELQQFRVTGISSSVMTISGAIKNHKRREEYAEILGTPEIKNRKRVKHAELLGAPEHDEIKNNNFQFTLGPKIQ